MNKAQPYLFWIVSGALLLLMLIVGCFFLNPTDNDGNDAAYVKGRIDDSIKDLVDLKNRAKNGDPSRAGQFDPENPEDIARLTKKYLITKDWEQKLQVNLNSYNAQLDAIKRDLASRSAVLHQEIPGANGDVWYDNYEHMADDVVAKLKDNGSLQPSDSKTQEESTKKERSAVGLFTKESQVPDKAKRDELTVNFWIVDCIKERILRNSNAKLVANPVLKDARPLPTTSPIVLIELKWGQGKLDQKSELAEKFHATDLRTCDVMVKGAEASLMALLAGLESVEKPVLVVIGAEFSHIDDLKALRDDERKSVAYPLKATIHLAAIDFTPPKEAGQPASPTTQNQSGMAMPPTGPRP